MVWAVLCTCLDKIQIGQTIKHRLQIETRHRMKTLKSQINPNPKCRQRLIGCVMSAVKSCTWTHHDRFRDYCCISGNDEQIVCICHRWTTTERQISMSIFSLHCEIVLKASLVNITMEKGKLAPQVLVLLCFVSVVGLWCLGCGGRKGREKQNATKWAKSLRFSWMNSQSAVSHLLSQASAETLMLNWPNGRWWDVGLNSKSADDGRPHAAEKRHLSAWCVVPQRVERKLLIVHQSPSVEYYILQGLNHNAGI